MATLRHRLLPMAGALHANVTHNPLCTHKIFCNLERGTSIDLLCAPSWALFRSTCLRLLQSNQWWLVSGMGVPHSALSSLPVR